jgi:hypothetical protein
MKESKPRLTLNKQTIAHLNNLEMINTRGGDGDDIPTRAKCDLDAKTVGKIVAKALSIIIGSCS